LRYGLEKAYNEKVCQVSVVGDFRIGSVFEEELAGVQVTRVRRHVERSGGDFIYLLYSVSFSNKNHKQVSKYCTTTTS
jgi:hypothetical protein